MFFNLISKYISSLTWFFLSLTAFLTDIFSCWRKEDVLSTGPGTGSSELIQAWPQHTTSALSSTQAEIETPVLEETRFGKACEVPGTHQTFSESKCCYAIGVTWHRDPLMLQERRAWKMQLICWFLYIESIELNCTISYVLYSHIFYCQAGVIKSPDRGPGLLIQGLNALLLPPWWTHQSCPPNPHVCFNL